MVPTDNLFISENHYLKSALLGKYINFLNPLLSMADIKLLQLATKNLYIYFNVTENWLWSTQVRSAPSIDLYDTNYKLKSKVNVSPLVTPSSDVTSDPIVKLHELLYQKCPSIFFKSIITSSPQAPTTPCAISRVDPVFTIAKVKTFMRKLDLKSGGGPDGFSCISQKVVNTQYIIR